MTLRTRAAALVLALVGTVAVTALAVPAQAAPGRGSAPEAGGLIAQAGVITFRTETSAGAATIQAPAPQSFCYVGVIWPAAILPDHRVTATWSLDCRSLANPNLPAPDIALINMKVRIHQGAWSAWDPTPSIGGTECQSLSTKRSCTATSEVPLAFGTMYHTQLDVTVELQNGAPTQRGYFYTAPIWLS